MKIVDEVKTCRLPNKKPPTYKFFFFPRKNIFSFGAKVQKRVTYSSHNNNIRKNRQTEKKKKQIEKNLDRQTKSMLLFPLEHLPNKILYLNFSKL